MEVERTAPQPGPEPTPEPTPEPGAAEQGHVAAAAPEITEPTVADVPIEAAAEPAEAVLVSVRVNESGRNVLFREARTVWAWRDETVSDDTLRDMYDLLKFGPTSANASPARFMFLRTEYAKTRLKPALSAGNADKVAKAPVVCIVAHDPKFYEDLPRLFPGVDARAWFAGNDELAATTAFRNGTLQGAYLIMAARAVGLDCAPMSGFDNDTVDREFFTAQGWKSNFLVALGHGDRSGLGERAPRLTFDEACRLL